MLTAILIFALAAGFAVALNGGGESSASAVATAPDAAGATDPAAAATARAETSAEPLTGAPLSPLPNVSPTGGASASQQLEASPSSADGSPLTGFTLPVPNGCVPQSELLLPGAFRAYRNGIHEGFDIYSEAAGGCPGLVVDTSTSILAAKDGIVVRADWDYTRLTQADLATAAAAGFQGEAVLDMFRGRQVWIDHGDGVVTRYAHLSAIAAGVDIGSAVAAGDVVGFAGESGTPESVQAPGTDVHVHIEIRVGDTYLGQGLEPSQARVLYLAAFGLEDHDDANGT